MNFLCRGFIYLFAPCSLPITNTLGPTRHLHWVELQFYVRSQSRSGLLSSVLIRRCWKNPLGRLLRQRHEPMAKGNNAFANPCNYALAHFGSVRLSVRCFSDSIHQMITLMSCIVVTVTDKNRIEFNQNAHSQLHFKVLISLPLRDLSLSKAQTNSKRKQQLR